MTKKVFQSEERSFNVIVKGKYATHSVVGTPVEFYVYVKENWEPWSKWIKGNSKLYYKLKKIHEGRNLDEFVSLVEETWKIHKK